MHPTSAQLNKEKNVERLQPYGFHGEEIATEHLVGVMAQERAPTAALLLTMRRGRNVTAFEHVPHSGPADIISELEQFTLDLGVTPPWVLSGQPYYYLLQLGWNGWSATPFVSWKGPFAPHQLSVPPKHSVGLEQQHNFVKPAACTLR